MVAQLPMIRPSGATVSAWPPLLWEPLAVLDLEVRLRLRRGRSRLSASHTDAIRACADDSISLLLHFAQIVRIADEVNMPGFARGQTHPRDATQGANRGD